MNATKKWLLLLSLLLLAWALPSRATFYVSYAGPTPATVYIDDKVAFIVATNWYSTHTARLRPGIHSLTLRQGRTMTKTWFIYFHLNSTAVEYGHFQDKPGLTLDTSWQLGKMLWN